MKRLILVEGLPGTGKTTISEWLSNLLNDQGNRVILLNEGDERIPCDFYEMAGIPKNKFEVLCSENPLEHEFLLDTATRTNNYAFLRIDKCPDHIANKIKRWDMGDENNQNVSVAYYIPCALERLQNWADMNVDSSETVIIDSGYLQNPVNELLFRHASDIEVKSFIADISSLLKPLNACCVYLKRNSAEEAISFAKEVKGPGWASKIDELLNQAGVADLFAHRFILEQELLHLMPHIVCEIEGNDWTSAKEKLMAYFI